MERIVTMTKKQSALKKELEEFNTVLKPKGRGEGMTTFINLLTSDQTTLDGSKTVIVVNNKRSAKMLFEGLITTIKDRFYLSSYKQEYYIYGRMFKVDSINLKVTFSNKSEVRVITSMDIVHRSSTTFEIKESSIPLEEIDLLIFDEMGSCNFSRIDQLSFMHYLLERSKKLFITSTYNPQSMDIFHKLYFFLKYKDLLSSFNNNHKVNLTVCEQQKKENRFQHEDSIRRVKPRGGYEYPRFGK